MTTGSIIGLVILGLLLIIAITPSLRNRITMIFKAKANNMLDAIENKIEILEQTVRDLEGQYSKSVEGLAQVKSVEIKYRQDSVKCAEMADEYRKKALKIKSRMESGEFTEVQAKADIVTMLTNEESKRNESTVALGNAEKQLLVVNNLEVKIKEMRKMIVDTKGNIVNLKANTEAAKINKDVNKQLSGANLEGVSAQIDTIKQKINADNAEAEAWNTLGTDLQGDEERINKMLASGTKTEDSELLNKFLSEGK